MILTLIALAALVVLTPVLTRFAGRESGWPLTTMLVGCAAMNASNASLNALSSVAWKIAVRRCWAHWASCGRTMLAAMLRCLVRAGAGV